MEKLKKTVKLLDNSIEALKEIRSKCTDRDGDVKIGRFTISQTHPLSLEKTEGSIYVRVDGGEECEIHCVNSEKYIEKMFNELF